MEKTAKSADPAQQKLRDRKRNFNVASKELIKRLIAFKRGLNGRGDPAYNLPTSNIKDPLPQDLISFLSELTSNFEQLTSEALKITQEQTQYSQNRRKPQKETPTPESPKEV